MKRDRLRNPAPWLDPSPTAPLRSRRRWGLLDLVVGLLVVLAVWSRTPVGALFDHGLAALTGTPTEGVRPLTAYFDTGSDQADALDHLLAEVDDLPRPVADGGFPEPLRTAAVLLLDKRAPAEARAHLDALRVDRPDATWGDLLDARHDGNAAATLEGLVVDAEQRERAIARALAAGARDAHRWQAHRAYLPLRDRLAGDRVVAQVLALGTALDLTWPVAVPHRVTSGYGHRHHPVLGKRKFHNGTDLGVPVGTPILAAQAGVVRTGEDAVSGRYVVIDHGHGVRTSYCHLDRFTASDGDHVEAGQAVALSGNTGRSTGPHLHFVVRVGRRTVDPERLRRTQRDQREPAG